MKSIPLQTAVGRLKLAERAVTSLVAAGDDPLEFQTHWLDFLVQWKGTYTKVQQAAKDTPQEVQWFGNVTLERKSDSLLRYLFEARNDGEHGINPSSRHHGVGFEMKAIKDIKGMRLEFGLNGEVLRAIGPDGETVAEVVKKAPAESFLIEVTEFDGKKKVPPPTKHLGQTMEPKPLIAADLGLRWLRALVATAEAMRTP